MFFARLRKATSSLRFRLTLWNSAVVLLLVIASLLAIRAGARVAFLARLNEFLLEETTSAAEEIELLRNDTMQMHELLTRMARAHSRRRLFLQLFDEHGKLLYASDDVPNVVSDVAAAKSIAAPLDLGDYRIMQKRLDARQPVLMLRVGAGEFAAEDQLRRITEILILVGGACLWLIPLTGYLLAGRATRPLANMIEATAALRPTQMAERLSLRGAEDELDRLAQTINGFLDRIAQYIVRNQEFTANAAHELRSPLTAMLLSLERSLNGERTADAYKELLADHLEECAHLHTLINQLLLLAEGDAGPV